MLRQAGVILLVDRLVIHVDWEWESQESSDNWRAGKSPNKKIKGASWLGNSSLTGHPDPDLPACHEMFGSQRS